MFLVISYLFIFNIENDGIILLNNILRLATFRSNVVPKTECPLNTIA